MPQSIPKLYRNCALLFLVAGFVFLFSFLFFILASAKIVISPVFQEVEVNSIVDVKEVLFETDGSTQDYLGGKIVEIAIEESRQFESSGTKDIVSDVVGRVKLINNYSKPQTLVETTRLLSPDGILLRTKQDVTLAPGDETIVSVYPDNAETFTQVNAARFTIPGLWEPIQQYIYAESDVEMKKGGFQVRVVTREDLERAESELAQELSQKALQDFEEQLDESQSLYSKLVQKEILRKTADVKIGEEKEFFTLALATNMIVIAFDEQRLLGFVKKNILESLPPGKSLKNFDANNLEYKVEGYDLEQKIAHVKVTGRGESIIRIDNEILKKDDLVGLSENEVRNALSIYPEIQDVFIEFYPSWVKKTPRFADRIEIVVE